jgi:hypothetical protein
MTTYSDDGWSAEQFDERYCVSNSDHSDHVDPNLETPNANDICNHFTGRYTGSEKLDYCVSQLQQNATSCECCTTIFAGLSTVLGAC